MRLAILSDTHVPGRADGIPSRAEATVREADLVIHTGDFDSPATLDRLRDLSAQFIGVSGNVDSPGIDLSFVEIVEVDGFTFAVTHSTGTRTGYKSRVVKTVRDAAGTDAVGVAGRTHEVVDEVVDGVRILNPGTATAANPGDDATTMVGTVIDGSMSVEVVRDDWGRRVVALSRS